MSGSSSFNKVFYLATTLLCLSLNSFASAYWTTAAIPRKTFSRSISAGRSLYGGPATVEPPSIVEEKTVEEVVKDQEKESSSYTKRGGWAVRLFNDPMNKREFVAMCLSKIVGLSDGQAYQVMMQAHQNGVSIVGRFDYERAELYKVALVEHGLLCDMIPVEDD